MEHQFRQRLRSGELLVGTMVTLGSPEVAEILASVGFDWLFLDAEHGPFEAPVMQYDLSASLGRLGEMGHPEVVSAIERVTEVCRGAGIPLGIFGASAEAIRPYIEREYTLIVAGIDTMMLGEAAGQLLARVKA